MRRHALISWRTPSGTGRTRVHTARWLLAAAALTLALPMAAQAALPRASTSPQVIAAAYQAVQVARKPVTSFPIAALSAKPPKNKLIVGVTCINQGGCDDGITGALQAATALGWRTQKIDGKGSVATWNEAVRTAITSHADGIVVTAIPAFLISDALQRAKAAHIPVVSIFDPIGPQSGYDFKLGLYAHVTPDHMNMGRLMADWVIANSKGTAHVIFLQDDTHPDLMARRIGFESVFAKCAGCKIDAYVQVHDATFFETLPPAVAAAVQQHPDTTYIVGCTDGFTPQAVQALQTLHKNGKIKVVGFDGSKQATGQMHTGDESASLVDAPLFAGWLATDQLVRAFAGQAPHDAKFVPVKLLDKGNIPAPNTIWDTDFNYRAKFMKAWGIK